MLQCNMMKKKYVMDLKRRECMPLNSGAATEKEIFTLFQIKTNYDVSEFNIQTCMYWSFYSRGLTQGLYKIILGLTT